MKKRFNAAKVQRILDNGLYRQIGPELWEVEGTVWYLVTWRTSGGSCTCKGFEFHKWCSHLEVVKRLQEPKQIDMFELEEQFG